MTDLYTFGPTLLNGTTTIPQTAVSGYTQSLSCLLVGAVADALAWALHATQATMALQVSYDGGVTWMAGGSSSHAGETNSPIAALGQFGGIYEYGRPPTHFKGTITTNGPLTLSGKISSN